MSKSSHGQRPPEVCQGGTTGRWQLLPRIPPLPPPWDGAETGGLVHHGTPCTQQSWLIMLLFAYLTLSPCIRERMNKGPGFKCMDYNVKLIAKTFQDKSAFTLSIDFYEIYLNERSTCIVAIWFKVAEDVCRQVYIFNANQPPYILATSGLKVSDISFVKCRGQHKWLLIHILLGL